MSKLIVPECIHLSFDPNEVASPSEHPNFPCSVCVETATLIGRSTFVSNIQAHTTPQGWLRS